MSKFKLNRNWNGHFKGEEVVIQDHLDHLMSVYKIGVKVEEPVPETKMEVQAENKAIVPNYKKRGPKSKTK